MNTVAKGQSRGSMSGLFIFLLIGMFALFCILLVLIGVGAYQGVVNDAAHNEQVRTSLDYIANKVRAADTQGGVRVETWHDTNTLVLEEIYDNMAYETRIYYLPEGENGGAVYEHFAAPGDDWGLDGAERIVSVGGLDFVLEEALLTLTLTPTHGKQLSTTLRLRAGGKGGEGF